nr:ribonuclease H-like domain-containing protein [Tanacetum cinerariifolium]
MTMPKMQLNSKFVNNMLPEWGRFMTAVKLTRGLKQSNYDQLYAYLKQHKAHANENKMMLERYMQHAIDPFALVSNVSPHHSDDKDKAGNEVEVPSVTVQQILARTTERKAKSTLLMAIPDEHLARFHGIKDAKTLWATIKTRFGAWCNISLIMRNKPGIDNLDIDDLYNNLKVYEADIKGSSGSFSNSHNVDFVSAESTSNTNELNAAYSVTTATCHSSQAQGSSSYADELMFSFFANQSSSLQLDNEDLEQIDQDDLEQMDIKWQVAMLSTRVKRFYKKTRRKLEFNGKEPVGFDKTKVEYFNYHRRGHFARNCRSARNSGNGSRDAGNAGYRGRDNEEEATNFALIAFTSNPSSSSRSNSEEEVTETVFDNHSSDEENIIANDRFKTEVFTRSGRIPVSADKPKAATSTSAAKPVNTAGPTQSVIFSKSRSAFYKSHSSIRTPFYNVTAHSRRNSTERVNTAGSKAVSAVKGNMGHPQQALKNKEIVDSGCSKHMTGNKAYLAYYQEISDGGFVAFGSSRGKITGKVTDDFSRFSWVFFLATKDETSKGFSAKSHNKTPYELLNGRSPRLDFMRPFGCLVTILNTLDPLGKFEGKADEGFLVGYSVTSKAFRVFNTKTKKFEENLHVRFLENKLNVAGTGPN